MTKNQVVDGEIISDSGALPTTRGIPQEVLDKVGDRLWERWPKETTKAFYAFNIYRNMAPERSLRRVGVQIQIEQGRPVKKKPYVQVPGRVPIWSRQFWWVERCRIWDEHIYLQQEREWLERQKTLREQQWESSANLFRVGLDAIKDLPPGSLAPKDIAKFLELGSTLGMSTRQEPLSAEYLKSFLDALPEQLRAKIVYLLKSPG